MEYTSTLTLFKNLFTKAIHTAFPKVSPCVADVTVSKEAKFGDYQCNTAMKLSKMVQMPPLEVAKRIIEAIPQNDLKMFESISVAPPGFINCSVSKTLLAQNLLLLSSCPKMVPQTASPQRIIIDFSSPNIAKEMHVGHLRSTIIGESLCRVFEACGHDVLRLNHVGDWGTAFGMLIAHLKRQENFSLETLAKLSLGDLNRLYKESKTIFDKDESFRKTAQNEVVLLQSGDQTAFQIWKILCEISEKAYQEIYDLLDVHATIRGESFYNPMLPKIVDDFEKKGLLTLSDGAKCVYVEGFKNKEGNPLPLMLQKSDGGYNYDTTDMAALFHRIYEEKADRIIYVTDSGQATHFAMIFAAAIKAKILDPEKHRVDHVPFGLVLGPDGKKFKTRSGETEKLIDLLTNAVEKAYTILNEKNPSWTEEEKKDLAKILGLGAIKYADLSNNRNSDYMFSYDKMLSFEGNTAAFLMYAYVRTESILKKVMKGRVVEPFFVDLTHPMELRLAKTLCRFPEVIAEVCETLLPNRLTDFLYGLSEDFNGFFRDCKVEKDPREKERIFLVQMTNQVLRSGLNLLGITVPHRM